MMTDDQKSKVAELKAAIAASAPATGGAPQEVRAAALVLRDELRQEGTTARVLARALGIHETTLCRWQHVVVPARKPSVSAKRDQGRGAGFRMVQVAGAKKPFRCRTGLRLVTESLPSYGSPGPAAPFPLETHRPPFGSTTGPPVPQTAPSLLVGVCQLTSGPWPFRATPT